MRIGFLELSNMGTAMMVGFLAAADELSVWNRHEGRTEPLIQEGRSPRKPRRSWEYDFCAESL
jgi:3-hydroxyisobutyrate dehydrogenase-like beta-hydroxyacid dehydrogenase